MFGDLPVLIMLLISRRSCEKKENNILLCASKVNHFYSLNHFQNRNVECIQPRLYPNTQNFTFFKTIMWKRKHYIHRPLGDLSWNSSRAQFCEGKGFLCCMVKWRWTGCWTADNSEEMLSTVEGMETKEGCLAGQEMKCKHYMENKHFPFLLSS